MHTRILSWYSSSLCRHSMHALWTDSYPYCWRVARCKQSYWNQQRSLPSDSDSIGTWKGSFFFLDCVFGRNQVLVGLVGSSKHIPNHQHVLPLYPNILYWFYDTLCGVFMGLKIDLAPNWKWENPKCWRPFSHFNDEQFYFDSCYTGMRSLTGDAVGLQWMNRNPTLILIGKFCSFTWRICFVSFFPPTLSNRPFVVVFFLTIHLLSFLA